MPPYLSPVVDAPRILASSNRPALAKGSILVLDPILLGGVVGWGCALATASRYVARTCASAVTVTGAVCCAACWLSFAVPPLLLPVRKRSLALCARKQCSSPRNFAICCIACSRSSSVVNVALICW